MQLRILVGVALAAACNPEHAGNGNVEVEERLVESFHGVKVYGPLSVTIQVGSPDVKVEVETDSNLQKFVEVEVNDEQIVEVGVDPDLELMATKLNCTIKLPVLISLDADGSETVSASGLDSDELVVFTRKGSDVVGSGRTNTLTLNTDGKGEADFGELEAVRVELGVKSSSDAWVWATEEVTGQMDGSGDVNVIAPVPCNVRVYGLGEIEGCSENVAEGT
jgi:hypothetical protein